MNHNFAAILLEKKTLAEDKYEFVFQVLAADFQFNPGQYLWLVLPQMQFYDPKGSRRAFSIASPATDPSKISLIFKGGESGYKKSLMALTLQTTVQIIGPFGSSLSLERAVRPKIALIAGGTGIAPFLSMLQTPGFFPPDQPVTIIHLNSSEKRAIYGEKLAAIAAEPNRSVVRLIGNFDWEKSLLGDTPADTTFFISGQPAMVEEVVSALRLHGVKDEQMAFNHVYPSQASSLNKQELDAFTSGETNVGLMVMEQSTQHIVITNMNGEILFVNQAAQAMTAYTKEEMIGNTPRLWGALMVSQFYRDLWTKLKGGEAFSGQLTNRKKNGELYYVIGHISPFKNKAGEVIGFIATEEDITRQVLLERMLTIQNWQNLVEKRQTEAIVQSIGDGVMAVDQQGKIILFNVASAALTGVSQRDALGRPYKEILKLRLDQDQSAEETIVAHALAGQQISVENHYFLERVDGGKIPVAINAVPVSSTDRQVVGAVVVIRNVTKLKEAERLKDEFVAVASHELRTPLTAIDGIISMLLEGEYGQISPNLTEPLKDINESSERLIHLVNDMLSLSRLEAGKLKYNLSDFSLSQKLQKIVDMLQPLAVEKHLSLTLASVLEIDAQADEDKFDQVLNNLIGNALKFTDQGGVSITITPVHDLVEIAIADTGVGIAKPDQAKLFGKFEQIYSVKERPPGTGLGLYVSLGIAQKMGGNIWLASSEPGRGSTFIFSLPMSGTASAALVKAELVKEAGEKPVLP